MDKLGEKFIAITRKVSPSIQRCELTHLRREPIDFELVVKQHEQYETCLKESDCKVHQLPYEPDLPDSVFVEDTAIVLDEAAVITRPGAPSRRPETRAVSECLKSYRTLYRINPPGTIDGGDVLCVNHKLYIGMSGRTNPDSVEQLIQCVIPLGYDMACVPVHGCLHLKSAVSQVADDTLLINRNWVDARFFAGLNLIDVDPSESFAANALLIHQTVIYPMAFPKTRRRLEEKGIRVKEVDVSELAKAEGAVTCCSLIVKV